MIFHAIIQIFSIQFKQSFEMHEFGRERNKTS